MQFHKYLPTQVQEGSCSTFSGPTLQTGPTQTDSPPTHTNTQTIPATKAGGFRKYRTQKPHHRTPASRPAPSRHPHLHTWAPGVLISWRTPSNTRLRKAKESGALADLCGYL